MDKKLLAMFRKLLALDEQALPDSISPEDFSKLIEKSDGKLFIKPEDFKNLQKSLSQKDVDLKKLEKLIDDSKKKGEEGKTEAEKSLAEMQEKIGKLTETIDTLNSTRKSEELLKQYPDIMPELLVGKSEEEVEKIVDKQRTLNKKLYGDSQHFAPPDYSTEAEVDEAIEDVKSDKTKNGVNSAVSVMQLERQKGDL